MRNGNAVSGVVREILSRDPVWAAYAIADLRPDLAFHCRWLISPDASGVALLFFGLAPPILLTAGSPKGVEAALTDTDLPSEVFWSVLPSHLQAVRRRYTHIVSQDMMRTSLIPGKSVPGPAQQATQLSCTDVHRLSNLYQHGGDYAPDSLEPGQLVDGFFYGIEDEDGSLASAGGTQVAYRSEVQPLSKKCSSPSEGLGAMENIMSHGVAAIGNIYTRPDRRGLGFGKAVTASITCALQEEGFDLIVLNVGRQNLVARSIYEKLGFSTHCHFVEGFAARK